MGFTKNILETIKMPKVNKYDYNELISNQNKETCVLNNLLLQVDWHDETFNNSGFTGEFFVKNNSFSDSQLELVNTTINVIPAWHRLINCQQHKAHDYCLANHTLSVINKIKKAQEYKLLNNYNKLTVLYAALLHDIAKKENEVDPEHPANGADKASSLLYSLDFDENFINTVYLLIRHHQIFGFMAIGKLKLDYKSLADIFKTPNNLDLLELLSIADIKSVKHNEAYFTKEIGTEIHSIKSQIKKYLV